MEMTELEKIYLNIKAFAFDVDGVMTDGTVLAMPGGELLRTFNAKDAFAMRMAQMKGYRMACITGGHSKTITERLKMSGFKEEDVYLAANVKIRAFNDFCQKYELRPEQVMYFGDDVPDIPVLKACGCGICPSDAVQEVKDVADYISPYAGGKCMIRNTLETVMRLQGTWVLDLDVYDKTYSG